MASKRWRVGCLAVYAGLCLAYALVWEHAHDEGTTFGQAVGSLDDGAWRIEPTPIARLYAVLAGSPEHGPAAVLEALRRGDSMHPPLHLLLLNRWVALAGSQRVVLSLPAILLGALALLGVERLARRLLAAGRAGPWAMLLLAVSPWFVGFTVLLRPYALALCLAVWATLAALRASEPDATGRSHLAFGVLSVAGLYTVYAYAFVFAWHVAILGLAALAAPEPRRRRGALVALALVVGGVVVAFTPWLANLSAHLGLVGSVDYWYFRGGVPLAQWPAALAHLLATFALGEALRAHGAPGLRAAAALLGALTVVAAATAWRRLRLPSLASRCVFGAAPLVPALVIASDLWIDAHTFFVSKTNFGLLLILLLAVIHVWTAVAPRALATAGLSALALLLAASTLASIATRATFENPYERLAAYLAEHDTPSHAVFVNSANRGYLAPLLLTLRDARVEDVRLQVAEHGIASAVEGVLGSGGIDRITLVHLRMYDRRDLQWRPRELERATARARAAGWAVARVRPSRLAVTPRVASRQLLVVDPTEVNYWAM